MSIITGLTTFAAYDNIDITGAAVDIFIYDTFKDSDGGAWRKRTQHTSWYNETASSTRGSRKEFPAVAVIVAESDKVTIYDGDTPDLDMWMVFNIGSTNMAGEGANTCVAALNGSLSVGSGGSGYDLNVVEFLADGAKQYSSPTVAETYNGNILERNSTEGYITLGTLGDLISRKVNDVAMTVLPNAPIDSVTGLPIPTIAVATDGGVSVIKDDGNVWDLTYTVGSNNKSGHVAFTERGGITWSSRLDGSSYVYMVEKYTLPTADDATVHDAIYANFGQGGSQYGAVKLIGTSSFSYMLQNDVANPQGLSRISKDTTTPNNGSVAYITSDYNTGYMVGDIKGAWNVDTDVTSLSNSGTVPDRSVNGNSLDVYGTLTVSAVATDAELKCISGFAYDNYLKQTYNSDLNLGTGDFSFSGWSYLEDANTFYYFDKHDTSGKNRIAVNVGGNFIKVYYKNNAGTSYTITSPIYSIPLNTWQYTTIVRRSNTTYIYINGEEKRQSTAGGSTSLTGDTTATISFGVPFGSVSGTFSGKLALWRVSATAPSAEQILEIYNAEKPLFQVGAKCTLNGSSDSVTALAYDDSNDELLVGTGETLSVFKGLRRVDENENNITEVAQQGGLRVEEYTNDN